jgi:hypothetical protein
MIGDDHSLAVERALSQGQFNCDCFVQMAQKWALENARQMSGISEILRNTAVSSVTRSTGKLEA